MTNHAQPVESSPWKSPVAIGHLPSWPSDVPDLLRIGDEPVTMAWSAFRRRG